MKKEKFSIDKQQDINSISHMLKSNLLEKIEFFEDNTFLLTHSCSGLLLFKNNQIREVATVKKNEKISIPRLLENNGPGWYCFMSEEGAQCRSYTIKEEKILHNDFEIRIEYEQEFLYLGIFKKGDYIPRTDDKKTILQKVFNLIIAFCRKLIALPLLVITQFTTRKKEIILVGENLGKQIGGNGYYFFNQVRRKNVYFVTRKTKHLETHKNVVKYNSLEHLRLFIKSKNLVLTHGPKDVVPTIFLRGWYVWNNQNVYHLQHGIIALKQIGLEGNRYFGSIKGFVVSNPLESEICSKILGFSRNQLIESGQPIHDAYRFSKKEKRIFVCPTWGDYGKTDEKILNTFLNIFVDLPYEIKNTYEIIFKVHPYVPLKSVRKLENKGITVGEEPIKHYLETSEIIITDYSSIVWYGLFLNCKIINLFHSFYNYSLERDMYVPRSYLSRLLNICNSPKEAQDLLIELAEEDPTNNIPKEIATFKIKNRSEFILEKIKAG